MGGQADVHADAGPNNFSGGMYTFYQAENDLFGVLDNTASPSTFYGPIPAPPGRPWSRATLSDHLRLGQYVTLLGGMRFSATTPD